MGTIRRLRQDCILPTTPSIFFLYKTKVFHHKNLNQFHKMDLFHRHHREPSSPRRVVPVSHQTPHRQPSPSRPVVHATHHTNRQPSPSRPVVHVSYQKPHHQPSPSVVHVTHHTPKFTDNKATVRFYCKAKPNFSLTIRDGNVVLAPTNHLDQHQHWIKTVSLSIRVKDEEGYTAFALVNKATGQAMRHSLGATPLVQLTQYNPDKLNESVLWTHSKDLGDGYHAVRMVNNIRRYLNISSVVKPHVGVVYGTVVFLSEWKMGANQRWSAAPF